MNILVKSFTTEKQKHPSNDIDEHTKMGIGLNNNAIILRNVNVKCAKEIAE